MKRGIKQFLIVFSCIILLQSKFCFSQKKNKQNDELYQKAIEKCKCVKVIQECAKMKTLCDKLQKLPYRSDAYDDVEWALWGEFNNKSGLCCPVSSNVIASTNIEIDCSKISNSSSCTKLKSLCSKLSSMNKTSEEYIEISKQYYQELNKNSDCMPGDGFGLTFNDSEVHVLEEKKIEEAEKKRLTDEYNNLDNKNKQDAKSIAESAKNIELSSAGGKKGKSNVAKIFADVPEPDSVQRRQIKGSNRKGCISVRWRLTPLGSDGVSKNDISWKVELEYQNNCDKYIINAWGDLAHLVYEGDPYEGQNLAARPNTSQLSGISRFGVILQYSPEVLKQWGKNYIPPMSVPHEFCRLALGPGDSGTEVYQISTPFFDSNPLNYPEKALYFDISAKDLKEYEGFNGLKRKVFFENKSVRISYELKLAGLKPFDGKFFGKGDCTEQSDAYQVNVYFENISGCNLISNKFHDNPGLFAFKFNPPQYGGDVLGELGVASKPISQTALQEFKPHLPRQPNQELMSTFTTWVHKGVPRGFEPTFTIGNYVGNYTIDTNECVKPATFFAYASKDQKSRLFIGQGKYGRIKATAEAENYGVRPVFELFATAKRFIASAKTNVGGKIIYRFSSSDISIDDALSQLMTSLGANGIKPIEPLATYSNLP